MKYFVFSDVHGFYDELQTALNNAGFDENNPEHMLISCGDNFDRGTQNVEMYNFLRKMFSKNKIILIRGNHEDLLIECLERGVPYRHDVSNGTFDSIRQFGEMARNLKISPELLIYQFKEICNEIYDNTKLVNFINENFIDYFETKSYVFVHGYIPLKEKATDFSIHTICFSKEYNPNWRSASEVEWNDARWYNGMEEVVKNGNRIPDKTVVVGHWHASYGNVRAKYGWDMKDATARQYEYSDTTGDFFKPFVASGIIAIDACTAFTKKVNVYVIEDEPLNK